MKHSLILFATYAKNILITGNRIEARTTPCIQAFPVNGLTISSNVLSVKSFQGKCALKTKDTDY